MWPYLSANYGLGIVWAAVAGLTFQFFLNMEIERYTLIKGESIFVGLARRWRHLPWWFIVSTLAAFSWPGIVAASAKILAIPLGIEHFEYLAMFFLILIGAILSLGPVLYRTVEGFQKIVIGVSVPIIIGITLYLVHPSDVAALLSGLVGHGDGYWFLPRGLPLFTFLGAMAYAGAGGNLNLAQSFYIKDKGYGMGHYSGRITSILTGKAESIELEGATFEANEDNINIFRRWWRLINLEHGLIFWLTGAVTIMALIMLAYITSYGASGTASGIDFIGNEGRMVGNITAGWLGTVFFLITGLTLFATQFTVLDATSRIAAENLVLVKADRADVRHLPKYYYGTVWAQILFGLAVFALGFSEPRTLITLGAVLNAVAMFVYIILVLIVNRRDLPPTLRPALWRQALLVLMWLFLGLVATLAVWQFFIT